MEPNAVIPRQSPHDSSHRLPCGQSSERLTPERFREQLGWALLQPVRR